MSSKEQVLYKHSKLAYEIWDIITRPCSSCAKIKKQYNPSELRSSFSNYLRTVAPCKSNKDKAKEWFQSQLDKLINKFNDICYYLNSTEGNDDWRSVFNKNANCSQQPARKKKAVKKKAKREAAEKKAKREAAEKKAKRERDARAARR